LPVKSYDFNAPIGEFGQINPQYYWLRRLHLFLHDFGAPLAQMPATIPDLSPTNKNDFATLRWSVRSDGNSGFVFVNNYQRLQPLPAKENVQFKLNLSGHEFIFPAKPVTIPADEFFFWPFNLDLGGVKLIYATAQLVCKVNYGEIETFFFAETPGVKAEFVFDPQTLASAPAIFSDVEPSRIRAINLKTKSGVEIRIILLNEADSLAFQRGASGQTWFEENQKPPAEKVETELLKPAGVAREIPLSSGKSHIAIAPTDADFTNAAIWKISLPINLDLSLHPILRIHYLGDVARLTLNGKLIADNFTPDANLIWA